MAKPGPQPANYAFYVVKVFPSAQDPNSLIVEMRALVDAATGNPLFNPPGNPVAFNLTAATLTSNKIASPNPARPNVLSLGTD